MTTHNSRVHSLEALALDRLAKQHDYVRGEDFVESYRRVLTGIRDEVQAWQDVPFDRRRRALLENLAHVVARELGALVGEIKMRNGE